ncbi:MAG: glycoside hydrolase family 2 protein [Treponema sp.]|jgi:beta-mannosidase|nr:glycoside hydrolase family 2 protein [Treponema sp.]
MACQLNLGGCWKLTTLSGEKNNPINANVPGSVLDTWIKAGIVPDPYYGENEKLITSLFDSDFEYSRTFSVSGDLLSEDCVELVCLGIDTLGEIFINDKSIACVNNMHRFWRFNVKELLKAGENTIRIVLFSPNAYIKKAYSEGPVEYINTGTMAGSNYLRKTHCQFGWDWGPMLPDAGIWRNIYLEGWSIARLGDVYVTQEHAGGKVTLRTRVQAETADLKRFWAEGRTLKAALRIKPPNAAEITTAEIISEVTAAAELCCTIEKPDLWWPNGLGSQTLYNVEVELLDAGSGKPLDCWERRIGLRTMTISNENDQWGREFALTVNGIKIFSMGADYIPEDAVFPRINAERTKKLLENCVKANFNSIRVWGGGYYPDDYFYDICDELGLVVWQDFMFACNIYHLTEDFAANVAEEIRQNMVRIRHHACIGLWCGNNEMEEAWMVWDNVKNHSPALKADYIKLFEALIPEVCKKTDPQAFYWASSPSSGGGFDKPNDPDRGDVHYWEVWHGLKPFSEYRRHFFRYCSEFGFQSLPDLETIQSFVSQSSSAKPEDLNLFSPVMECHQRNPGGNGKILYYLAETYRYPKDFASLVYISQILQMESIQSGVDHWRRHRGRCMGAVYWQLNDCWPVTSWASIDYYGRWKALHYGARRFFAAIRATVFIDETEAAPPGSLAGPLKRTVRVFVHNDSMKAAAGKLKVYLRDSDFTVLAEETLDVKLPALAALEVLVRDYRKLINTVELERSCFVTAEMQNSTAAISKEQVSAETVLFVPPKYFSFKSPEYKTEVSEQNDHFAINVKANTFCRFVRLKIAEEDVIFSDNYFDIVDEDGVRILVSKAELKKSYTAQTLKAALTVFCVGESY